MIETRLAEIEERANKATEGPWLEREELDYYQAGTYLGVKPYYYGGDPYGLKSGLNDNEIAEHFEHNVCRIESNDNDKEFIKHARTDIPKLIKALRVAIEQRDKQCVMWSDVEQYNKEIEECLR